MKRYTEYKETGIEWLGKIPEHWEIKKLKYLIREKITDGPHETPKFIDKGIPFLSVDSIQDGEIIFEDCRFISQEAHQEYRKKCTINKDDILIGKAASIGKIARVKVDFEFGVWSPLAIIKNNKKVESNYLEYVLKSPQTQYQIEILCTSNTQKNISMDDIPKIILSLPKPEEQKVIVSFLNTKTQKLDSLIDKRKIMIELLQEERTAIINQAVTKGINPKAKMKDSGIEWIGEIPEHWEVKKLKYLLLDGRDGIKIGPFGSALKLESIKDKGIKVYGQENVINNNFSLGYRFINEEKFKELQVYEIFPEDIVVTMMGTIGKSQVIRRGIQKGIMDSHLIRIRMNKKKFLSQLITILINDSFFAYNQFKANSKGSIMEGLNSAIIKDLFVLVQPLAEQDQIVKHIESETSKIDKTLSQFEKEIALLQEYKTALISEAVTGKIDVREEVQHA